MLNGEEYYQKIVETFGKEILKEDLEIDRKKLANIVFYDKGKKIKLDNLTKIYVASTIKEEIKKTKEDVVVIDAPLLFETDLDKICNITIGVIAKKETCIERIVKRDNITKELAYARINNQKSETFFKINCSYCIINEKESNLEHQINEIFNNKNLSNKEIIHLYNGEIEYLQFRKLLEFENKIIHCYTLKPLNFGHNKNYEANKDRILRDYKTICKTLNLDYKTIYRPYQTHTDTIKILGNEPYGIYTKDFQNVDGLITEQKNKILSLSFADCIALYFYDPVKNVIANIHSGWQGTYKQIGRKAVKMLKEHYNCNPQDIICAIGPSIGKCCFEVEEDVKNMFYNQFKDKKDIEKIIIKQNNFKYTIDTVLINRIILEEEGLNSDNIIESKICTKCNSDKLHSYREEKELSGRNTSIITLV